METKSFIEEELVKLRASILDMASRVESDIGKALAAFINGDKELAKEVIANDKIINDLQLKIEDETATAIATQAPVAGDMRELITIFKIAGNLERIGDYAVHLAKAAIKLSNEPPFRSLEHIEKMAETGQTMLRSAVTAFLERDADAARETAKKDFIIDSEHKLLTEEILDFIKLKKGGVKKAVRMLKISGNLERLGDHITTICESVVYMVIAKREELND